MNKIEFKQFLQNTKDNIQEKLNPKKIGTKISVSLKSKKTRKNLIIYAFLTLFCIAFLLLLSASTSPLYKDLCDGDSSIFIFFGKAITLGKDAYRVSKDEAFDYVLGYSVLNDVSARNLQKEHKQFYFGKSLDTHTTMGPWIVTRDELPGAPELDIAAT